MASVIDITLPAPEIVRAPPISSPPPAMVSVMFPSASTALLRPVPVA
jgi:hypothetical protein